MSSELVFKRKQLFDQIGMDLEDVKLIMKYQKELPILCSEENEINLKALHSFLGIKKHITQWIKPYLENENYGFVEGVDYQRIDGEVNPTNGVCNKEFLITIDMAKELAMMSKSQNGKLARRYFIICEKALKLLAEWNRIREPEKGLYKELCKELDKHMLRNENKHAEKHNYIQEANMLNKICLGANAKDIREYIEAQDKNTRDWLTKKYNEYLYKMQELDIMYLRMNMSKEIRSSLIQQGFKAMYPNASFIMADIEVKRIIHNKKQYTKDSSDIDE